MFSGLGNDVIDGGLGTDIVVYSGAYSGGLGPYTIAIMREPSTRLSAGGGSDKLSNVELLSFSDAYVMASNNVDIQRARRGALVPLLPIIGISGGDFLTIGTNANWCIRSIWVMARSTTCSSTNPGLQPIRSI
jgi:hypothetical protein